MAREAAQISHPTEKSTWVSGLRLHREAFALLRSERSLWRVAALSLTVSMLVMLGLWLVFAAYIPEGYALLGSLQPDLVVEHFYQWLWVGPLRFLFALFKLVVIVISVVVVLIVSFSLANVVAAPFQDELSQRVERCITCEADAAPSTGWKQSVVAALRSMREELKRTLFLLSCTVGITLCGWLIPGAQLLAPFALAALTLWFLPLDFAAYALDRRSLSFKDRRRWLRDNGATTMGFALGAYVMMLVPGLNLFTLPILVVGGTLLVIRSRGVSP